MQRQRLHAPPGRSLLTVDSPSSPITIFTGRLPTSKHSGPTPTMRPHPHRVVKISQPEHGGNGERRCIVSDPPRMVNKWLPRVPVELRDFAPSIHAVCVNLLQQIITVSRLRFRPLNLFDCARLSSFCGLRGGAKDLCDDRDGYNIDGPGERRHFPGSCI